MNAFEIEEAISALAEKPFDAEEFPFSFLQAFSAKDTTIRRLRSGETNKSDLGGVLQTTNIHIKVASVGNVTEALSALKSSPATTRAKAKFILATDGVDFQAEDLNSGEVIVCEYSKFPDFFGFFLPLAGISTVKQIRESSFDIKATGRLNRLYLELLKDNPDWSILARRHEMNHFMARLIFCFFAEDTDIFSKETLFTSTIEQMSSKDSSNTHVVIEAIFRAMNTKPQERDQAGIPRWANVFPYVNGGLFSGTTDVPKFSKIARTYLLHIGNLDWRKINPDIFGSMIQAVADDEERGALGMHYTSVPNILKVLNPLFLNDLREKLEEADDNPRKLLNLRSRMSKIRVFDPACGSGNFLVIAYKQMREIESEINKRRGESERRSDIPLTNFRGIELRSFPAEIARLALIIAEYQCDVLYRGQKEALAEFLPLDARNWITCGNALELDWLSLCSPTGTAVKIQSDDLFGTPLDQAEIDFENEGGETYICGNPPYIGRRNQDKEQKAELKALLASKVQSSASLDYVFGWIEKASDFIIKQGGEFAFVTTNSVTQGTQIPIYWPHLFAKGLMISFAHRSFKWANNAAHNAGVTVVIIGVAVNRKQKKIYDGELVRDVDEINAYLLPGASDVVATRSKPISEISKMNYGNLPGDGNYLTVSQIERENIVRRYPDASRLILPLYGAQEFIKGLCRYCIWINDDDLQFALSIPEFKERIDAVRRLRAESKDPSYNALASRPHQYRDRNLANYSTILAPQVSSETRPYLPTTILEGRIGTTNQAFAIYDAPIWNLSLIASQMHLVWVTTVCGKLETRIRYSNTLGWNTFPVPQLTEKNKADLTRCAEDIVLAREAHFPATIADLYDPEKMPADLKAAHERNDEVLESIYIGRRFRNDTERLEKLFELYTKMNSAKSVKSVNTRMKA